MHVTVCEEKPSPPLSCLLPSACVSGPFHREETLCPHVAGGWALGLPGVTRLCVTGPDLGVGSLLPSREEDAEAGPGWGRGATVPPALLCTGACKMFDIKIMTAIGVALLIAIVLLMFCVTSLLFKLTGILK